MRKSGVESFLFPAFLISSFKKLPEPWDVTVDGDYADEKHGSIGRETAAVQSPRLIIAWRDDRALGDEHTAEAHATDP